MNSEDSVSDILCDPKEEVEEDEDHKEDSNDTKHLNSYLEYELKPNDLVQLNGRYKESQRVGLLGSSEVTYYKRFIEDDEKKEDHLDIFTDVDDIESFLITKHQVLPRLAKNLSALILKYISETKTNMDIVIGMVNMVFERFSLLDMSVKRSSNSQLYKFIYCTHALNLVLKSKMSVSANNSKLSKMNEIEREQASFTDRGFVRSKVLIMLPFKNDALEVVEIIIALLQNERSFQVDNKKRFKDEFSESLDESGDDDKNKSKPEDFQLTFSGNIDDHFRLGLTVMKSSLRLYTPFYSSDIIICSPIGLRTIIGEKGESHYEFDFLSSMELVVADYTDVYLMQNWEHLLHIYKNLHLNPKDGHNTDIFRIFSWALDGHSKHYCQHLILSEICNIQITSLATNYCNNHRGLMMVKPILKKGSISLVGKPVPQIFHRIKSDNFVTANEERFKFFTSKIFSEIKKGKMNQILLYIPQYYDFVKVRNYFRKKFKDAEGLDFRHISEYSEAKEVAKARRKMVKGEIKVLLYSERYHFYYRPYLKGIQHIIFYDLPTYPNFYYELCNMIKLTSTDALNPSSVIALYSPLNHLKIKGILGDKSCHDLISSDSSTNIFLAGISTS